MSLHNQMEADLDVFVSINDFAVEAIYTPVEGDPKLITGIFDDTYKRIDVATGVESGGTTFLCKSADIEGVTKGESGDTLEIDDIVYTIIGIEPDGTGMTLLRLSED